MNLPVHSISHSHTNQSILRHLVSVGEITLFNSVRSNVFHKCVVSTQINHHSRHVQLSSTLPRCISAFSYGRSSRSLKSEPRRTLKIQRCRKWCCEWLISPLAQHHNSWKVTREQLFCLLLLLDCKYINCKMRWCSVWFSTMDRDSTAAAAAA